MKSIFEARLMNFRQWWEEFEKRKFLSKLCKVEVFIFALFVQESIKFLLTIQSSLTDSSNITFPHGRGP